MWFENQTAFCECLSSYSKERQSPFLNPVISAAVIHSDGVRAQISAPLFSIKSQALGEEMKENFPIFGGNTLNKMA